MEKQKSIWFKNKYFGLGWRPASWQGWVVLLVYVLAIIGWATWFALNFYNNNSAKFLIIFYAGVAVLTVVLFCVCCRHSEKLRWRWGGDDKDNE